MKKFKLFCQRTLNNGVTSVLKIFQSVFQWFYDRINDRLPEHIKLPILGQLNQFINFILMPGVYLVCKFLSYFVDSNFSYLPLILFLLIYAGVLLDYRIRLWILKMNSFFLNSFLIQIIIYYVCCVEQIVVLSPLLINTTFILIAQSVLLYKFSSLYVSSFCYVTLWILLFYYKVRKKYFNVKALELTYGHNYGIPTWSTLVVHWNKQLHVEFQQFEAVLPKRNVHHHLGKRLNLENRIGPNRQFPFAFLGTRDMTSNPLQSDAHKMTQDVVQAILKNVLESSRIGVSALILCAISGTFAYFEHRRLLIEEKKVQVQQQQVQIQQQQIQIQQQQADAADRTASGQEELVRLQREHNDSLKQVLNKRLKEDQQRKTDSLIEQELGQYLNKGQLAKLKSTMSNSDIGDILKKKPASSTVNSSTEVIGIPSLPPRINLFDHIDS